RGPLAPSEIALLAVEYLGDDLDPVASRLIVDQSEGNPFFAEELLRGWLESGALELAAGGKERRTYVLGTGAKLTLPTSIIGAVRQRLGRLPPETREIL